MNRRILIILLVSFLFGTVNSYSQILNRVRNRTVERKIHNKVRNEAHKKGEEEAVKGIKKGIRSKYKSGKSTSELAKPNQDYNFSYQYDMKMSTKKSDQMLTYYFKPQSEYMGMQIKQENVDLFAVFDFDEDLFYTFMKMSGRKMYSTSELNQDIKAKSDNNYNQSPYKVTDLPDKKFLGYTCKGKQAENKEYKITVYYTNKTEISQQQLFSSSFQRGKKQGQNDNMYVFNKYFKEAEKGLIMYVENIDKKHLKNSSTLECVKLEKTKYNFSTKNYTAMDF